MKSRNKWITIVFLVFILAVPAATVIRGFFPKDDSPSQEQLGILEGNGTVQNGNAESQEPPPAEGESSDTVSTQASAENKDSGFTKLQVAINGFTNGLLGRSKLIAFNTKLTSLLTGGTYIESTQVLLGKNDMFFYKTELDGHPLWDYMGINHFADPELASIAANIVATRDHLKEKGIEFYAMCVPNKEIIYQENMPDTIAQVNEISRGEQLETYIRENTDLVFVYPKEELREAREKAQIWYNTDTHCNQKGSFACMQALFREAYGTWADLDSVQFDIDPTGISGDLVYIAGLDKEYPKDIVYVLDTDSTDKAQYHDQVLLFVGDSFGGFLSAVSKGYYKKVYWEHPDAFNYEMYEKYQPDVVILEWAERYCERFGEPTLIRK